jgi:UDP-glucose 4-epimerase
MTWLITGTSGFIGSHLIANISLIGERALGIDFRESNGTELEFPTIVADFGDLDLIEQLHAKYNFSGVVHLAALKSVSESIEKPELYLEENFNKTKKFFMKLNSLGVRRYIFASSAAVYAPSLDYAPIDEAKRVMPLSPYGQSKLKTESWLDDFAQSEDLQIFSLRFFNVVGANLPFYLTEAEPNIFPALANSLLRGKPLTVFGNKFQTIDGTSVRDYIDIGDLVAAVQKVMELKFSNNCHTVLNLGSGREVTLSQLIKLFESQVGSKVDIEFAPPREGEVPYVLSDSTKITSLIDWKATTPIEVSVSNYLSNLTKII